MSEKLEFIVQLNACIFWQVKMDLMSRRLERTELIKI